MQVKTNETATVSLRSFACFGNNIKVHCESSALFCVCVGVFVVYFVLMEMRDNSGVPYH